MGIRNTLADLLICGAIFTISAGLVNEGIKDFNNRRGSYSGTYYNRNSFLGGLVDFYEGNKVPIYSGSIGSIMVGGYLKLTRRTPVAPRATPPAAAAPPAPGAPRAPGTP